MNLTEAGLLGLAGLITAFLVKCCNQIENSRCTTIDFCGIKCQREVLTESQLSKMNDENKQEDDN